MIRILLSRFVYRGAAADAPGMRTRLTFFAGVLGILCNLFLFVLKLVIGMLAGSVAITSDAFNNLSDAGSSLVAAISARLADQKPDAEHPWGHGRLEYVASLIVSFLILFVGIELLRSSFSGLFEPTAPSFSLISLIILGASVLVKLWMWSYNRYIASLTDAAVLRAASADSLGDALSSSVVILSAVIGMFLPTSIPLDAIMGMLVSLMILKCGWGIAKETVDLLLGTPADVETTNAMASILLSGDGIIDYHDLLVHDYGPGRKFASVHAEISDRADICHAHEVVDALEVRIYNELGITAVIHTDPVTVGNAYVDALKQSVCEIIAAIHPDLSMHDFRITDGENRINLIFDLVVPFSLSAEDSVRAVEEIRTRVTALDARFRTVIKIDTDYTAN
ncbi:MAG: cation transporter [Clostridia bacterium]|nr:cation transporter [Clostridia bacterium]